MTFTGPSDARQAIRELLETYSDAVVRKDVVQYLSCWAENGRRTGAGGDASGHAELGAHFTGVFGAVEQMAFFTQPAAIAVDGTNATARSYTLEFVKGRDGSSIQVIGEYTDALTIVNGTWVFASRHYRVVMLPSAQ
jgi:hypothetical protein